MSADADRKQRRRHPATDDVLGGVYFVTDGELIKIGYSGAPTLRMEELQTGSARPLILLGVAAGTMNNERSLHSEFRDSRVRGEWFRPTAELLNCIAETCGESAALTNLRPDPPFRQKLTGPALEAMKMRTALNAWSATRSQRERDIAWVLERQVVIAARHPESGVLRDVVALTVARLAQETQQ